VEAELKPDERSATVAPVRTFEPDVSQIVEHCRAIFHEGLVSPETAADALHQINEALRRDHALSDAELKPITQLIAELCGDLGRGPTNETGGSSKS
jgi:hypothetical protein